MREFKLVVRQAFGDYAVGDEITDAETMERLSETHPHAVVKTPAKVPKPLKGEEDDIPALTVQDSKGDVASAPAKS